MKKNTIFMCLSLGMAAMLTSCSFDNKFEDAEVQDGAQKGKLTLSVESGVEFQTGTRAVDESTFANTDNYTVNITKDGASKFSGTFASLKALLPMELDNGSYNITASYGAEMPASRETFLATGSDIFTIRGDQTTPVSLVCTPTAGKIQVVFDASMETYCASYKVIFSGTEKLGTNTVTWNKGETAPYYLAISENGETVNYTINVTAKTDYAPVVNGEKVTVATVEGNFQLERNHTKKLTVKPNYTPTTDGGLSLDITIDDSVNPVPVNIEVPLSWI